MYSHVNTVNNCTDFGVVNPDSSIGKFVKSSHCLFSSGALVHGKVHFMKPSQSEGKLHVFDIDRVPDVFRDYMKKVLEYGDRNELFSDALVLEFSSDLVKNIEELQALFYQIAFIIAKIVPIILIV